MNATDIYDKLSTILVEQLGCDPRAIHPTTALTELGADSLDLVEIVMACEEDFAVNITDEEAERLTTVQDYVQLLQASLQ
jgi:acyl carrier protein